MAKPRTVEDLLREARRRLRRFEPAEAYTATQKGALILDIHDSDPRLTCHLGVRSSVWVWSERSSGSRPG